MTSRKLPRTSVPRTIGRVLLGSALVFAGTSHLTFGREDFRAQVPEFVPLSEDVTVLASGVAEISLGAALIALRGRRVTVGWVAAIFFTVIFPGNIAQLIHHRDAFGLDTDTKRGLRLLGQPLLIAWALWSTGAWRDRKRRR